MADAARSPQHARHQAPGLKIDLRMVPDEHKYSSSSPSSTRSGAAAANNNPFSLIDLHRLHSTRASRPKPNMADAVQQALHAHPHTVSGFLVLGRYNAARTASAPTTSKHVDGPIFAFGQPQGSAASVVNRSAMAMARVMARAQQIKFDTISSLHATNPRAQTAVQLKHPQSQAHFSHYSNPQPYIRDRDRDRDRDALRNAGASVLSSSSNTRPDSISPPSVHIPHLSFAPLILPPAKSQPHPPSTQPMGERSARIAALESHALAASMEAARLRAERRAKAEEDDARQAAELERRRAARATEAAAEQAKLNAERAYKRGLNEGSDSARREPSYAAPTQASRAAEADHSLVNQMREERRRKQAAEAAQAELDAAARTAERRRQQQRLDEEQAEAFRKQQARIRDAAAAAEAQPPKQVLKKASLDTSFAAGSSLAAAISSASLESLRDELKRMRAFLQHPGTTLLPRLDATGIVAELTEKELSVLVECGRDIAEPLSIGKAMEYLSRLQRHEPRLYYLDVIELAKDLVELRAGREPSFGMSFNDQRANLKSNAGRVYASWITAADRTLLFEYLAASRLFVGNVKLSNRTLDELLTECSTASEAVSRCTDFSTRQIQFASALDLVEGLRAVRIWKAGNAPGATLVNGKVMSLYAPGVCGDPGTLTPIQPLIVERLAANMGPTIATARNGSFIDPSSLTPQSKAKALFTAPSWITPADRDRLFEYLASPDVALFSSNVKLSNRTLNMSLDASTSEKAPGSAERTIQLAHLFNEQGLQFATAAELVTALKVAAAHMDEEELPTTTVHEPATSVAIAPTSPVLMGVAPPSASAAFITTADRDALFAYLSDPEAVNLFAANVQLSNKTLDAFLSEGGSLAQTIEYCSALNEAGGQYATTTELLEAVKRLRAQRETLPGPGPSPTARMSPRVPTGSLEPIAELEAVQAAAAAVMPPTPAARDQLFEYLASPDCLLFAVNVKLSNKALDSLLLEAGGSAQLAVELCSTLNRAGQQYATVPELVEGMQAEKAQRAQAAALKAEARLEAELEAKQAERQRKKAEKAAEAKAERTVLAAQVALQAATLESAEPAEPPLTAVTITPSQRDALFDVLASPDLQLFSQDAKLNNAALNGLLMAGTSLQLTEQYCREFQLANLQFATTDDLIAAIEATHQAAMAQKAALLEYLLANQVHIFTPAAFPPGATITAAMSNALYVEGRSGLYTLSHMERIWSTHERVASVAQLAAKIQAIDAAMGDQHRADAQTVEQYLAKSEAKQLFPDAALLTSANWAEIAAAGRQSLYAPSRSVEYMHQLALRGLSFTNLTELLNDMHHGVSNPNTARSVHNEPISARNRLDASNDLTQRDLKHLLKVDHASASVAKDKASKGDSKTPSSTIPVPKLAPLSEKAEARRHEAAMIRIALAAREDEDRLAANKTALNSQLVIAFSAKELPKMDLLGSCDCYLEIFRFRAYQDQVTAVIWEQMKSNLWQSICKTDTVMDTLNPTFPTSVWAIEPLCSGEYDRPILVKAFDWNRREDAGEYIAEFVTTLREMLERAKNGRPFELLSEKEAKKNPRTYKHSGLVFINKAEVTVPRSIVAVRTVVSAIQSSVVLAGKDDATAPQIMQPVAVKCAGAMAALACDQIIPTAAASGCLVWFTLKASNLDKLDTFGKSDPFVRILRVNPGIPLVNGAYATPPTPADYVKIFDGEVIEHTLNPEWRAFVISLDELCSGNVLCPLIVRVLHRASDGSSHALIGEFSVDLYTLLCRGPHEDDKYVLVNSAKVGKASYRNSGSMHAKVKLLSKHDLAARDATLCEDLACRAPFLLGWQPGLELKAMQDKHKRSKSRHGSSGGSAKSSKHKRSKSSSSTSKSSTGGGRHSRTSSADVQQLLQEQSLQARADMMTKNRPTSSSAKK